VQQMSLVDFNSVSSLISLLTNSGLLTLIVVKSSVWEV